MNKIAENIRDLTDDELMIMTKTIYIDGGCSGNPGPMRIAMTHDKHKVVKNIGNGTNNRAEYLSLLYALVYIKHININADYIIKSDSQLLVKQVQGLWKIKSPELRKLHAKVWKLIHEIEHSISIQYVPRNENCAGWLLE